MLKPHSQILYQKLGNEAVILSLDSEEYFGLDKIASRMWEILCEHKTVDASIPTLLEEFDTDEETLRRDMIELVNMLLTENLLVDD